MTDYYLKCWDCGHEMEEDSYVIACPKCAGLLEIQGAVWPFPDMPLRTPLFHSPIISNRLGIDLWMKDETLHPTGTWKDREGPLTIWRLQKHGIEDLAMWSSGNAGSAVAVAASKAKGPTVHLIVPRASKGRVDGVSQWFDPGFVDVTFKDGSNDEVAEHCAQLARFQGYALEGGFFNYARREGLKTFALEAYEQAPEFDWYVQAVAGAIGIYAYWKAARDLERQCPKLLGVQASVCAPISQAWKAGAETIDGHIPQWVVPSEFVRVLRTRRPDSYKYVKRIAEQTGGAFEDVTDSEIYQALRLFYKDDYWKKRYAEGATVGLEPATALAGLVKGVNEGYVRGRVLLNVSGAAKKGDVQEGWIADVCR